MSKYEIMYIMRPTLDDAAKTELMETLAGVITSNGGTISNVDDWGLKEFAYKIEDMTKGYYVVLNVEADAACVAEFDRRSRINNQVVRHMIVNLDKQ